MTASWRAALWLIFYAVYLRCMPATFYFEDSPELMACSFTFGNTHPPGYPLLALLGRLAQFLPAGGLEFRFNLLIAACAAGAVTILAILVSLLGEWFWPDRSCKAAMAAGLLAAGTWAFSDAFWWEAVIGDKYAPFYFLFMLVILTGANMFLSGFRDWPRRGAQLALSAGICFAYHLYAVFILPLLFAVFVWTIVSDRRRATVSGLRALLLLIFLCALPLNIRGLYPPIRSAAGVDLDWGQPGSAVRLKEYLSGKLYHGAFASTSIRIDPERLGRRLSLSLRLLREEIPLPLLAGVPVALLVMARANPWLTAGLAGCGFLNWAYSMNFSEKIVRWYEPAYALLLMFSSLGFLWAARRIKRGATLGLVALALLGPAWQLQRGYCRCDLSRFFAGYDFARNLLLSLPADSVYLGAGDFDLFPLWAIRYCRNTRPDVEAIGMASFLDPKLAGAGSQARLLARLDLPANARAALARLLEAEDDPKIMIAPAGYDARIYEEIPGLVINRTHGLAGRFLRHWDAAGSFQMSLRLERAYTYRGLRYARAGALSDLVRPRDEVARGALLHYPLCFTVLGRQGLRFGMTAEAVWAYGIARRHMEALVGPLDLLVRGPSEAQAERFQVAEGFLRLADLFDSRGVYGLARQYRECARAIAE